MLDQKTATQGSFVRSSTLFPSLTEHGAFLENGVRISGERGVRISGQQGVRISGEQGVRISGQRGVRISGCGAARREPVPA